MSFPRLKNRIDLSRRAFWVWVVGLVAVRLALTAFQQAYTWVGGAPLDDELMFRAAQSISAGQWLGGYDYLTLSKSMFFPVWLAFLHALHIPYLLGGVGLWCAAGLFAAFAFSPLWEKLPAGQGRAVTLGLFAALAYLPTSWASYTLRVYRDNIFPALCLLAFAGFSAAALRVLRTDRTPLWPWLLAGGAGLTAGYLNREDAGLFLLPFTVLATLGMLGVAVRRRRWTRALVQLLPYAMLAGGIGIFCALNQAYYGVFTLSDFSGGAFADAMGAMSRVATDAEDPMLSVPADARQKLYAAVPELEPLSYWLEEDPQMINDFRDPQLEDYRAGSFYWAIRRAAQYEGIYDTAAGAEAYWQTVADKVNAACEDGTLPTRSGRRSGTTQPIRAEYVLPTLKESVRSLGWVLTFQDCAAYETQRSIGTPEDFAQWSGYLHCGLNGAAEAGKDTPYYSPNQKLVFGLFGALRLVWAFALPVCFILAVLFWLRALPASVRAARKCFTALVPWTLQTLLLFMAALRCGMIAFVEVSSFGIGTSTMYLATVQPLLVLFTALSFVWAAQQRRNPHAAG
ncbi:hypothetical protein [uncultured Gemmiger sp.]|uniref:hypothetical protein n=1 Tax=uncultured Gemmiger sp. TaxID=1623490 RepID=UPI0025ED4498|nr:hypothetical protein [uncultured Gemmiger sp.]